MQETQRDVSLESEPLADAVRSCEFLLKLPDVRQPCFSNLLLMELLRLENAECVFRCCERVLLKPPVDSPVEDSWPGQSRSSLTSIVFVFPACCLQ